ncbi:MAG TPA: LTA synthase family protein, partial [Bacteroidia bacterium]|nr:LTA synthase family protein [Bacteroidia bacterium]
TGEPFSHSDNLAPVSDETKAAFENPILSSISKGRSFLKEDLFVYFMFTFKRIASIILILFTCFFLTHLIEIIFNKSFSGIIVYYAFINDVFTVLCIALVITPVLLILAVLHNDAMKSISWILCFSIFLIHISLSIYFFKTSVPLGSDLFAYSWDEIMATTKAAGGFSFSLIGGLIAFIIGFIFLHNYINGSSMRFIQQGKILLALFVGLFILTYFLKRQRINKITEFENYLAINKSQFFATSLLDKYSNKTEYMFSDDRSYYISSSTDSAEKFINADFPFLKHNSARNTLGAFFKSLTRENKPNVVFLILEGMGSDFTGKHAKLGSFTPFLDSLELKSLFWENALSSGGRTFAALPSLFSSAPFLKQGYLEEGTIAPKTTSLFSILNCNGYSSSYYTGSDASFDKMDIFLKAQGVEIGSDVNNFGKGYTRLPSFEGFSWGYGDLDIFKNYFSSPSKRQPFVSVFFTVANHSPYLIPSQDVYKEKARKRIAQLNLAQNKKEFLSSYLNELSCLVYTDDALRYFFNEYSKRKEFKNTIFIITGDHRAPEIPISFQIDRFRVPLMVYSPLLTRTATFKSIATHFDVTPSLLALLSNSVEKPTVNSWIGSVMDTSIIEVFNKKTPLMRNKNEFQDYLDHDYLLSGDILYKLSPQLDLEVVDNESKKQQLQSEFELFKQKNAQVLSTKKLLPDSVLFCK